MAYYGVRKIGPWWRGGALVLLVSALLLLPSVEAGAQTSPPDFTSFTVSLWPEFDRSDLLVIYTAQLSSVTEFPAQVTFSLPDYIWGMEDMHAVAVEQGGELVNVDPEEMEWVQEGGRTLLTFPVDVADIQLEYYDPMILTRQDQTRQISYTFSAPYDLDALVFEVQHPFRSEEFSMEPEPVETASASYGLLYSRLMVADWAADEVFEMSVTYSRPTDELSAEGLGLDSTSQPGEVPEPTGTSDEGKVSSSFFYYVASALGGAAIASLIWWWVTQQRAVAPPPPQSSGRKRPRSRKPKPPAVRSSSLPSGSAALYCVRCGTRLQEDADFCHICGAERSRL